MFLKLLRKTFKKFRRKLEYNPFRVGRYPQVKNVVNLWSFLEEKDGEEEKIMSIVSSQSAEIGAEIT